MEEKQILLKSIDKLHTTEMGINRIKKNRKRMQPILLSIAEIRFWIKTATLTDREKTGIVKLTMLKSPSTHTALRLSRHTG